MKETDLPCSDCGADLIEHAMHANDLPIGSDWHGSIRVAECPMCGARHYPEETLSKLAEETKNRDTAGGTNGD